MKCQKCDKVATFHIHITDNSNSAPEELHLCDEHAYQYLHQSGAPHCDALDVDALDDETESDEKTNDESLKKLTDELMETDFQSCPCCGIGFQEFRKTGRLGCANDYQTFRDLLEPLLLGVHGATEHIGKRPSRFGKPDSGALLVHLRNELNDAVETEDYERASKIRDKIKELAVKTA